MKKTLSFEDELIFRITRKWLLAAIRTLPWWQRPYYYLRFYALVLLVNFNSLLRRIFHGKS